MKEILNFIIITFIYYILNCIREGLIRNSYFSVKDSIFGTVSINLKSKNNVIKTILSNILYILSILFVIFFSRYILKMQDNDILFAIIIASFLSIWPYTYFFIIIVPNKRFINYLYALIYISEIVYTYAICIVILYLNLWYLIAWIIPIIVYVFECLFIKHANKFYSDFSIENRYLIFAKNVRGTEIYVNNKFGDLIKKSKIKYNLPDGILKKIIVLEVYNRGSWFYRISKNILAYVFPNIVKKMNLSIGIAQVKHKTILKYYNNKQYDLKNVLRPSTNIDIAAFELKNIINEWNTKQQEIKNDVDYPFFSKNQKEKDLFLRYLYTKYTAGAKFSYPSYLTIGTEYLKQTI